MTDVKVDVHEELVERYAARIRVAAVPGREVDLAGLVIDALTDHGSRHSNAQRLQRIRAVQSAALQVLDERRRVVRT